MKTFKSSLLLPLLFLFSINLNAQTAITQLNDNYFVAGPPSGEIESFAAQQDCMNWCWAACVQTVLNYHGLLVDQREVVQRVYGDGLPCLTGNAQQIMDALSGWAPDVTGRYSKIYSQFGVYNAADVIYQLSHRWPIIVGLQNPGGGGHAYVLTAVYYSFDQWNNPIIDKVVLRNPWPESPSREEMYWNDFANRSPQFFKVWVVRQ